MILSKIWKIIWELVTNRPASCPDFVVEKFITFANTHPLIPDQGTKWQKKLAESFSSDELKLLNFGLSEGQKQQIKQQTGLDIS